MCYNPIRILNKSRKFDPCKDQYVLDLPCGQCGECRTQKQNEFELRCYYEALDTINKGGFVIFDTFTYNQNSVPRNGGFLTFRAKDYTLFMQRLRDHLKKDGFQLYNVVKSYSIVNRHGKEVQKTLSDSLLKVFWTSEYGGVTKRPHYHALFFSRVPGLTPDILDSYIRECWDLGRTDLDHSIEDRVLNGQGAISYVAKYVSKDIDYMEIFEAQKYSERVESMSEDEYKEFMNSIKCFHRQSNGLGKCMVDYIDDEMLVDGQVPLRDDASQDLIKLKDGTVIPYKLVQIPMYIDRKLYYDYDPTDKSFNINDFGREKLAIRNQHKMRYISNEFYSFYNTVGNELSASMYFELAKRYKYITNKSSLYCTIDRLLNGRTFDDLALYACQYYNRTVFHHDYDDLSAESIMDMSFDDWQHFHSPHSATDYSHLMDRNEFIKSNQYRYGNLPAFKGFDQLIALFNYCKYLIGNEQQRLYIINQQLKSQYKHIFL